MIDTNLLLLLMVGQTDQAAISRFGRTEDFKDEDFDNVTQIAEFFAARKGLSTTPHVLAEVSNLLGRRELFRATLARFVGRVEERWEPAERLVQNKLFRAIGPADIGLLAIACQQHCVLTRDGGLAARIGLAGGAVINYNHIRFEKI